MSNKHEELLNEELEKGESSDEKTAINLLPSEIREKWEEMPTEKLEEIVAKRKEIFDRWAEKRKQMRAERSGPEISA